MKVYIGFFLTLLLAGCAFRPLDIRYKGPTPRPESVDEYYSIGESYVDFSEELIKRTPSYMLKRITLKSSRGEVTVDYFKRYIESDDLVIVFPVLGGRNIFSNHFAAYFAEAGFDSAIIHRNGDFKNPDNIDRIEEIFRINIIHDRMVLDFFEEIYKKKQFGSFGISRGAINAAMTAGVDDRLKYNVLAMGGTDLVSIFRESSEKGIKKFKRKVMKKKNMTEEEFLAYMEETVRTDPKNLAKYIDAKNTLMFLSVFDDTVPVKYGMQLRKEIGKPDTVFLVSGHYTSIAYTQFVPLLPPFFPPAYVETEAVSFYNRSFKTARSFSVIKEIPVRIFQLPFKVIGRIVDYLF